MSTLERTPDGKIAVTGVPAHVAARLADLVARHGKLQAQDVLTDARDPKSPLHGYFEWNNTAAAEAWRLQQAAGLIRRVKVTIIDESDPEPKRITVRAYVAEKDIADPASISSTADDEQIPGTYLPIDQIVGNTAYESNLIEAMRRDIARLKSKYANTELLLKVLHEEFAVATV